MNLRFFKENQRDCVTVVIEESKTPLSEGCFYQGFGTPRGMAKTCIEPLHLGGGFLAKHCTEITEAEAEVCHPEIYRHIEARRRGGCFYVRIGVKDVRVGMDILIGQGFHRIVDVFVNDSILVKYVGGLEILNQSTVMRRYHESEEAEGPIEDFAPVS